MQNVESVFRSFLIVATPQLKALGHPAKKMQEGWHVEFDIAFSFLIMPCKIRNLSEVHVVRAVDAGRFI